MPHSSLPCDIFVPTHPNKSTKCIAQHLSHTWICMTATVQESAKFKTWMCLFEEQWRQPILTLIIIWYVKLRALGSGLPNICICLYIYICLHIKATLVTQIEVSFKSWVCHSTHGLATSVFLHPGRNNWHWNPCEIALDATFQLSKWSRAYHSLQSVFCLQMPSRLHWGPQARCSTWIP